jgi:hypothetical protein
MTPRHAAAKPDDDATPNTGAPTVNRKGVNIPWSWLAGIAPLAAMGGAVGHAQVFGAPPEFSVRLNEHQTVLTDHERRITELDKGAAIDHAAQARMAEDIRRILTILERHQ